VNQSKFWLLGIWLGVLLATTGCGRFVARRIVQAPNSYPSWLSPDARVELAFSSRFLTNFASQRVDVGPPSAQLRYRIVEPADYGLRVSSTNWVQRGRRYYRFSFEASVPGGRTVWTAAPRGTVVLLHGYGLGQFSTAPWGLRLAQEGWRCVLVDLRGHGASTGNRVYFGLTETNDLSQLLDTLERRNQLVEPIAVLGESYGAALSLRWGSVEPRVGRIVAIAPYARLATAILNIRREYAGWFPKAFIVAGVRRLPDLLRVEPGALDTLTVLAEQPAAALFVAGADDRISPMADVRELLACADAGSRLIEVPEATHEAVSYFFDELVPPVVDWLSRGPEAFTQTSRVPGSALP
jgi:pimeloyl-ACP methyl ester carboxylesterase